MCGDSMSAIIKREMLDHLQSIQFLVLTAASLVLFAGNAIVFVRSFPEETAAFSRRVADTDRQSSTVATELNKRPNALRFIADGGDRYRSSGYTLRPGGRLEPLPVGQINYKMPDVPELDWSFLIAVVFSLYVILLGFNAISGEKELGTLRLVLSYRVSRVELLAAKFIAILLVVMVPLLMGGPRQPNHYRDLPTPSIERGQLFQNGCGFAARFVFLVGFCFAESLPFLTRPPIFRGAASAFGNLGYPGGHRP